MTNYIVKEVRVLQIEPSIYEFFDQFFEIEFPEFFFNKDSLIPANDRKILPLLESNFGNAQRDNIKLCILYFRNINRTM